MPSFELVEAVKTSTGWSGTWIEVGVLVKRYDIVRVPVAKDVATAATVVPAVEVAEVALACRIVTDGGLWVRLPVLSCRLRGHLGKELQVPTVAKLLPNLAGSPGARREDAKAREVSKAVATLVPLVVLHLHIIVFAKCSRFGELRVRGKFVVRAEDSGHIHRLATALR